MNKTAIKVIKRKDALATVRQAAKGEVQSLSEPKLTAPFGEEKIERSLRRTMANTVSSWIAERRENKRAEEISAFRKLFGDEFLSGRTA